MAILNSIRKRGFFLVLIIALALFAFVLDGLINKKTGGGDKIQNVVASINGTEISREQFMGEVDAYQRSLGPNGTTSQAMNTVWDRELRNILFDQQAEALGLSVSDDQLSERLALTLANNPTFQDENGMFSEAKMVEYIAAVQGNATAKKQWDDYVNSLKKSILQSNYSNLIRSGLVTTVAEGEQQYHYENDKINIEYVFVPYTKIADEDAPVTDAEIEKYVKENPKQFEVDPMVDIQYVSFSEEPSLEDIGAAQEEVAALKEPFATTEDYEQFINSESENSYVDRWYFKKDLPASIKDTILSLPYGTVYGPYNVDNTLNLTKVVAHTQLPDSVEARHILIPVGMSSRDSIARTPEQAKALADSLLGVLKKDKSKFKDFVTKYSSDTGSSEKGGHYDWFPYNAMVAPFRDFCFESKVGDMGVVETQFGYHLIEVEAQKNKQEAVKIATITKEIEPSEATLSQVFSESAKFEEAVRNGDFTKASEEKGLTPKPVNRIGRMDSNIPGVGNNRTIINWAFDQETEVGDVKRFNINDSYIIAQLTRKNTEKALMSVAEASATVTPILRKQKKAKKIRETLSGTTLQEIAASQNVTVKTADALTLATPTIAGAGTEPTVVGMAFGTKVGETTNLIDGDNGVFKVRVLAETKAPQLENFAPYVSQLKNLVNVSTVTNNVFKALKKAADIKDNRADFY